jgi:hypothetical protein
MFFRLLGMAPTKTKPVPVPVPAAAAAASPTVQLTNTALGQTWQLTAAAPSDAAQPAHFVVLQGRPATQSLTVLDNRSAPGPTHRGLT